MGVGKLGELGKLGKLGKLGELEKLGKLEKKTIPLVFVHARGEKLHLEKKVFAVLKNCFRTQ
ncbi:hypothetical protein [Prevotella disiens]|uniref:hypothetical protein n=1 Tax=Prevotella disiens TaxID=28130 RepID=UPI0004694A12|nr:hypothetical protein [Prevotella disiens]